MLKEALEELLRAVTQKNRFGIAKAIDGLIVARLQDAGINIKPIEGDHPIDVKREESKALRAAQMERIALEQLALEEGTDQISSGSESGDIHPISPPEESPR